MVLALGPKLEDVAGQISRDVAERLFRRGATGERVRLDDLADEYWLLRFRRTQMVDGRPKPTGETFERRFDEASDAEVPGREIDRRDRPVVEDGELVGQVLAGRDALGHRGIAAPVAEKSFVHWRAGLRVAPERGTV